MRFFSRSIVVALALCLSVFAGPTEDSETLLQRVISIPQGEVDLGEDHETALIEDIRELVARGCVDPRFVKALYDINAGRVGDGDLFLAVNGSFLPDVARRAPHLVTGYLESDNIHDKCATIQLLSGVSHYSEGVLATLLEVISEPEKLVAAPATIDYVEAALLVVGPKSPRFAPRIRQLLNDPRNPGRLGSEFHEPWSRLLKSMASVLIRIDLFNRENVRSIKKMMAIFEANEAESYNNGILKTISQVLLDASPEERPAYLQALSAFLTTEDLLDLFELISGTQPEMLKAIEESAPNCKHIIAMAVNRRRAN